MPSTPNEHFEHLFKIVLIGDSNVGKTNILNRLIGKEFSEFSRPTIGVEFGTKTFSLKTGKVKAQIWDTAGQERYNSIISSYYRGAKGGVIVYDITNEKSLKDARLNWLIELRRNSSSNIPIMLIGNKSDLENERTVEHSTGKNLSLEENVGFFETSAVDNSNIEEAFKILIEQIYKREKEIEKTYVKKEVKKESFNPRKMKKKSAEKKGCC